MQTLQQQELREVAGAKNVRARIYRWKFQGGWGHATQDADYPKEGRRPLTNFFLHSRDFESRSDLKVMNGAGDEILFDVLPQQLGRGEAIRASRIRLVRG